MLGQGGCEMLVRQPSGDEGRQLGIRGRKLRDTLGQDRRLGSQWAAGIGSGRSWVTLTRSDVGEGWGEGLGGMGWRVSGG